VKAPCSGWSGFGYQPQELSKMNRFRSAFILLLGLSLCDTGYCLPPMQLFVELTPTGGILRPPPGVYSGPVNIKRRIMIEGNGEVTIDGGGNGTVVQVKADASSIPTGSGWTVP
jgi:nitrous oxidase accessory protein